ncbi:MAG: diaminopimelate epimerase [Candidatus Diapherotrites archaeon]|uniref:Diaminopimelate epimerase n=1 Tax=Candidatus Iainarchaeum sp. TaxID=3101447 RepID=A0A938YY83_9ARCH|nr:diaminopimelate epimerase [Candidatus Diapherotrites archaeon]
MIVPFSKLHGLGNDFIVVDELQKQVIEEKDRQYFASKNCKRNFSVGADGLLFLCRPDKSQNDFRMRIFNSDGSEAETCVNGLRCAAFEAFLLNGGKKKEFKVETGAGLVNAKIVRQKGYSADVELELLGGRQFRGKFYLNLGKKSFEYYSVDLGNPHAVVFLKEPVKDFPVEEIGHKFEWNRAFQPERTNTEFVNVISPKSIKMRVHERGACETMACGSGAIASVIAGIETGLLSGSGWVKVEMLGGTVEIKAGKGLFLKGPAKKVFTGSLDW